jgi:transcriptional regulator with XRE-family HTH domain
VMTDEARVLKLLRSEARLSMRQVAQLVGLSDAYVAHLETGRIDVPGDDKLKRLLKVYGTRLGTFRERARSYRLQVTPEQELLELIKRMRDKEIATVLAVARSLVS